MILFGRDLSSDIAVVAEVGVNHGGSVQWILDFLPSLKKAGVDAVKFQLFTPNLYSSRTNINRNKFLNQVKISQSDFLKVLEFGKALQLPIFATPLSHDWVNFIAEVCGVVKIASGDFTFIPTLESALNSNAQIIASTGAASESDIKRFMNMARASRNRVEESVALLHCISAYPPPLSQANLCAISRLKDLSGLQVGFSSHFLEDAPIYAALALGARIFEIHVTDNRTRTDIRDHALSRTPHELSNVIKTLRGLATSLQASGKLIQPAELEIIDSLKKGVVYSRDLPIGHVIAKCDLTFARPLNPAFPNLESVIGLKLYREVHAYHSVVTEDFG
jgi:sialic acid synthase SpsE